VSGNVSPLRYPGGKAKNYAFVRDILYANALVNETYVEPFAGGAGLALKLLLCGDVKRIVLNDLDPAVYAFWDSVLHRTNEFCEMVMSTKVTVEEWKSQRAVYSNQDLKNPIRLGFATFFLNRTNVSGVIKGGVIGGLEQAGPYAIDARFNKDDLVRRIRAIAQEKDRIVLSNLDAKLLLDGPDLEQYWPLFINLDPPYVNKGARLYKNSFSVEDHRLLAEAVGQCPHKWIVTYDVCPLVTSLYSSYRYGYLDVRYSVRNSRKAREYVFFSDDLVLPQGFTLAVT
jgi:DNA adenine methylase